MQTSCSWQQTSSNTAREQRPHSRAQPFWWAPTISPHSGSEDSPAPGADPLLQDPPFHTRNAHLKAYLIRIRSEVRSSWKEHAVTAAFHAAFDSCCKNRWPPPTVVTLLPIFLPLLLILISICLVASPPANSPNLRQAGVEERGGSSTLGGPNPPRTSQAQVGHLELQLQPARAPVSGIPTLYPHRQEPTHSHPQPYNQQASWLVALISLYRSSRYLEGEKKQNSPFYFISPNLTIWAPITQSSSS